MKSKIYSSEYMKSSSKGQRWIPAFAMIAFLLAFPVAELILMGKWNERSYTQSQLSYLYSSLWSSDFLTMGAAVAAIKKSSTNNWRPRFTEITVGLFEI